MKKTFIQIFVFALIIALVSGCTAKTYSVRKEREDQQMVGNAGYLGGTPPPEAKDRAGHKETRKTYILEFTTGISKTDDARTDQILREADEILERAKSVSVAERSSSVSRSQVQGRQVVVVDEPVDSGAMEYTVQENDTLQKISLKFYNTNHKWTKIYEANKSKIKNPDRIKPGIVIRIPR